MAIFFDIFVTELNTAMVQTMPVQNFDRSTQYMTIWHPDSSIIFKMYETHMKVFHMGFLCPTMWDHLVGYVKRIWEYGSTVGC